MGFLNGLFTSINDALTMGIDVSTPLAVALAVNAFLAASFNSPFQSLRFRARHLLIFAPFLITAAVLLWGEAMRYTPSEGLAPAWPQYVLSGILALHIPSAGYFVKRMKGHRWFALSLSLFQIWCSMAAAMVASIAISGDGF